MIDDRRPTPGDGSEAQRIIHPIDSETGEEFGVEIGPLLWKRQVGQRVFRHLLNGRGVEEKAELGFAA